MHGVFFLRTLLVCYQEKTRIAGNKEALKQETCIHGYMLKIYVSNQNTLKNV